MASQILIAQNAHILLSESSDDLLDEGKNLVASSPDLKYENWQQLTGQIREEERRKKL